MICFCAWIKGYCIFPVCKLGGFSYSFRSVYSVYAMPKTAARDIHGRSQYDIDKLGLDTRKPVFWACEQ